MKRLTLKPKVERVLTNIVCLFVMYVAITIDNITDFLWYDITLIVGSLISAGIMYLLVHFGKDFD